MVSLLELLDVVAVAPSEELPIDRGRVVTRQILPILAELDAEALKRAPVQADEDPFDDGARNQLERPDARHDGRVEKGQLVAGRVRHHHIPLAGAGTVSSSRVMTVSASAPSDSA